MKLSRAAAGVSFLGALAIGMATAGLFAADVEAEPAVTVTYKLTPMPNRVDPVWVQAEDLVGVWRGTWDHAGVPATLTIKRTEGNRFSGILKQGEAEVAFAGTIDERDRRIFFHETKVVQLGSEYGEWSLGTNSGAFSADGNILSGTGIDRWGTYQWTMTKE